MAILTINTSSNYSAIKSSLANGDTIRITVNGVRLTVDEQPLLTNIIVDSPAIQGRMTVSGNYDLSTWSAIAGASSLIDGALPSAAILGSITGGTASNASGLNINNGTVITATGGTGLNGHGVTSNNGLVTNATGGAGPNSHGVNTNNGLVTTATGGSLAGSRGVSNNLGTVLTANGGAASGAVGVATNNGIVTTANGGTALTAYGVTNNNGTVDTANGGTALTAYGINSTLGSVLRAFDGVALGINLVQTGPRFIIGPDWQTATTNYLLVQKVYSLGPVSSLAAIPGEIEIIELSEGLAGFTGIRGTTRKLGT